MKIFINGKLVAELDDGENLEFGFESGVSKTNSTRLSSFFATTLNINGNNNRVNGVATSSTAIEIKVEGNAGNISTMAGDVAISGDCHEVNVTSGDVRANVINGSVTTMSGDIHAKEIKGKASSMSGDVNILGG